MKALTTASRACVKIVAALSLGGILRISRYSQDTRLNLELQLEDVLNFKSEDTPTVRLDVQKQRRYLYPRPANASRHGGSDHDAHSDRNVLVIVRMEYCHDTNRRDHTRKSQHAFDL